MSGFYLFDKTAPWVLEHMKRRPELYAGSITEKIDPAEVKQELDPADDGHFQSDFAPK